MEFICSSEQEIPFPYDLKMLVIKRTSLRNVKEFT